MSDFDNKFFSEDTEEEETPAAPLVPGADEEEAIDPDEEVDEEELPDEFNDE